MLKIDKLEDIIKEGLETSLSPAFEEALRVTFPAQSNRADDMAKKFSDTIIDIAVEPLAQSLASAIDYYVKTISISGTIITVGSPTTQTATINSSAVPTNGILPNSLKIE